MRDGWAVLARRARTPAGELDLVMEREGLLAFVEVKARPSFRDAAFALSPRQRARLAAAAECWLAANPGHGAAGIRFDHPGEGGLFLWGEVPEGVDIDLLVQDALRNKILLVRGATFMADGAAGFGLGEK